MSKNVVLTLESRFIDEYGEYANLPVFNAHGSIVGYVGGEVPESGNPCEFNRLDDEGFTYCASATEVVRLKAENAKLRESVINLLTCVKHEECEESCPNYEPMYTDYGYEKNGSTVVESEYLGCCTVGLENCNSMLFDTDEYLRELGIEVGE